MADHDDWTADDDARLRAALTSLRADVEAAPLTDVRFVKARGMARRRQRLLSWTAAAAAAAVVAGTVGYSQFGQDATLQTPPQGRTGTTSAAPSPTTASSLDIPGTLPVDGEWQESLGLPATSVTMTPVTKGGGVECGPALGAPKAQQSGVVTGLDTLSLGGAYWASSDSKKATGQTEAAVEKCENGPGFAVKKQRVSNATIYSYTAPGAGVGWFAVVAGGQGVALLQISENGTEKSRVTADQVNTLATAAQARLDRYATSSSPSSPTSTATGSGSGPTAIDEVMQVTGPAPVPSSDLFVAASQWTDPLFAKGAKASAGPADPADSTGAIGVFCETDSFLAGVGGQLGEVEVRAGNGDANVIGHQRVRVDQSADPKQAKTAVSAQLAEEKAVLVKGCTESDGKVTAAKGPTDGTYLLTKQVTGGAAGTDYRWVGVAPLSTPGAWTTIVFHGTGDGQGFQGTKEQGFAELDRLIALARQK